MNLSLQFVFALMMVMAGAVTLVAVVKGFASCFRKKKSSGNSFELFHAQDEVVWAPWASKWYGCDPAKENGSGPFRVTLVVSSAILANRPGANPMSHPQAICVRPVFGPYDPLAKKVAWSGFWFIKTKPTSKKNTKERRAVA